MTFKGYLEKNGYLIRVSNDDTGSYEIEYSNDGFEAKQVKVYGSRYAFLKAMELRFSPKKLNEVLYIVISSINYL